MQAQMTFSVDHTVAETFIKITNKKKLKRSPLITEMIKMWLAKNHEETRNE